LRGVSVYFYMFNQAYKPGYFGGKEDLVSLENYIRNMEKNI